MKKKLILGIVAAALALSLAVGGTLMLFTDATETATNVVTLGNVDIALYETNPKGKVKEIATDTTNDYGIKLPGDDFTKSPFIKNVGDNPAYVKVEAVLTATTSKGKVNFKNMDEDTRNNYLKYLMAALEDDDVEDGWIGGAVTAGDDSLSGTWYYASGNEEDGYTMTKLEKEQSTDKIFTTITVPDWLDNSWQGIKIQITLKGYAVQTANVANEAVTDISKLDDVFKGVEKPE